MSCLLKKQRKLAAKKTTSQNMERLERRKDLLEIMRTIKAVIPPEFKYIIKKPYYAFCEGIKFRVDVKLNTTVEFYEWMKAHEALSGVSYLPKTLLYSPSPIFHFKGYFQCAEFTTTVLKKGPVRTRCRSKLQVSILAENEESAKRNNKDNFAARIIVEFNHNHRRGLTIKPVESMGKKDESTKIEEPKTPEVAVVEQAVKPAPEIINIVESDEEKSTFIELQSETRKLQKLQPFEEEIEAKLFGETNVAKPETFPAPAVKQEKIDIEEEETNLRILILSPPETEKEETKRKLETLVNSVMQKWTENTKQDIADAVNILYDRCYSLTPSELCLFLSKI